MFDVAWSGDRKRDARSGKVPAVGNTVDVKTATYANTIGATELAGEWVDPTSSIRPSRRCTTRA